MARSVHAFMANFDILLSPVADGPAPPHSASHERVFAYALPWSLTRQPAASIPFAASPEGLPLGRRRLLAVSFSARLTVRRPERSPVAGKGGGMSGSELDWDGSTRAAEAFHIKLAFVLKRLSISRGALAAALEIDKSVVGRWVTGSTRPTEHNLSRLSALVAGRIDGFTVLDWERPIRGLAAFMGSDPATAPGRTPEPANGPFALPLMDLSRATIARRAPAYEGFFRTTRPYAKHPGRFIHDVVMIRRSADGELRFDMATGGVKVDGLVMMLQNQLYVVSAELTSGAFAFAILNGVGTVQVGVLDGLVLHCSLDAARTPTATRVIVERICDLRCEREADDAHFAELMTADPLAPEGSVPPNIVEHLTPELGPGQFAKGGELLLTLPLSRSLARGLVIDS